MPGLDALRGVAVLAVVAYHGLHWWLPPAASYSPGVQRLSLLASPGWLGVNLFFVLSGFLITGILLDTRTRPHYWKNFYVRRVLRILPLYVALLVLLRFYGGLDFRYLLLCLLYLANFAIARQGIAYGPLWSLAVEEQFYLVWPFLVRRLQARTLATVCVASILLSPVLRYLSVSRILPLGDPYSATWLLTDNLAIGALIAILLRTRAATPARIRTWTLCAGTIGALLLLLGVSRHLMSRATAIGAAFQTEPFLFLFAALLLLALQYGSQPAVFAISRPLRFYGYISYGLYLFHVFGFMVFQGLFLNGQATPAQLALGPVFTRFLLVLVSTTLFCFLSRRHFEEYFLRMKERLAPYSPSPKSPPGDSGIQRIPVVAAGSRFPPAA